MLHNWKTHADSTFEFGKGTNVLVGRMGSGKSCVMDAVCFALFGTFPGLQARRISLEEVIQSRPNEASDAAVQLLFDYADKQYRVERTIKRHGSSEAKLYCEGKLVAGPKPSDVNKAVERAIEIGYNLFSRAVYSEQNEIDYFLRLSPRDRKQRFDELLDLRKYETVRANAVSVANRLRGTARDKRQWLQQQRGMLLPEEEKDLHKRAEQKELESQELLEKIKEKEKAAQLLEKEATELEKREQEFNSLHDLLVKSRAKIEELQKAIGETRKESKGKTEAGLEAEKKELGELLQKKEKELKEAQALEKKKERELSETEKAIAVADGKEHELREHLLQLQGIKAVCPVCRRKLEEKTREQLIDENKAGQRKLALDREKAEKQMEGIEEKLEQTREKTEKTAAEKEKLWAAGIELKHLGEKIALLAEKERQLGLLLTEADKTERRLHALSFDEKALQAKRRAAVEEKAAIESSRKSIAANSELVKELRERLLKITKTKEQLQDAEGKVERIENSVAQLLCFNNSLQATQSELRLTMVETINQAMESIWQGIYPYRDFVAAKMHVEEGSYELKVKTRAGGWQRVEGILSGGERSAAAICIRIAFSLVLTQNLGWLILDEPTHNLDSSAVSALSSMFQQHLPQMVEQIFVITHDSEMRKAASANLYVLERNKDTDGATKPVQVPIQA